MIGLKSRTEDFAVALNNKITVLRFFTVLSSAPVPFQALFRLYIVQ